LASLLLFTTLVAVLLSAFTTFPGLGIALTILAVPALARTCFVAIRTRDRGQPMPVIAKIHVFLVTLGVVTLIAVAVGATFYGTCWAGFFGGAAASSALGSPGGAYSEIGWGLVTGIILGIIAGLVVAFFLIRFCWRRMKS
jgi:nitroreductase